MRRRLARVRSQALLSLGPRLSTRMIGRIENLSNWIAVSRWLRRRRLAPRHWVVQREELFDLVGRELASAPTLYLEFGVSTGESMRYWSRLLRHPDARLHGFDTFEGLPEAWTWTKGKGEFSAGGEPPKIADPRVAFYKGMFQETLPTYSPPPLQQTAINFDADLYSSTIAALRGVRRLLRPGTWLYFDEFRDRHHELKAFDEFLDETGLQVSLVGADHTLTHVLFRQENRIEDGV